jgi:hypothetical protein
MLQALLLFVKRHAHDKHRPAVLGGGHAPGGEARAVTHALDAVDDGAVEVAGKQKVGM